MKKWLTSGALFFLVAGSLVLGVTEIIADKEGPGLPPRPEVARPVEGTGKDVALARQELSKDATLGNVIRAVESKDIQATVELASPAGDGYCAPIGRGGGLPEGCSSANEKIPSIYLNMLALRPYATAVLTKRLEKLFSEGGDIRLAFATRDSRTPSDKGGEYYFMFQTERAVLIEPGFSSIGLELKVVAGDSEPIQWFGYAADDINALEWLQSLDYPSGAKYHILITPETVENWDGME